MMVKEQMARLVSLSILVAAMLLLLFLGKKALNGWLSKETPPALHVRSEATETLVLEKAKV